MGRPPAYIFVVRHGNRLDAADNHWHLHSPTPYDPPLTYGGWMHSRTVGARIAAILQDEANHSQPESESSYEKKRRRFRIVLHSSPFLRCVQTSIAISAGLASNPTLSSTATHAEPLTSTKTQLAVPASSSANPHDLHSNPHKHHEKSVLRLDPFLGEWLSPEYFEHITPPPESALMLATAKAELLRRSSYHDYPHFHIRVHSSTSSHLWSNASSHNSATGTPTTQDPHSSSGLETLPHLADSLPGHEGNSPGRPDLKGSRRPSQENHHAPGYAFPVPSYALSTSDPIPKGYVAHARDACTTIDYQWDSSRDNLAWGDGGMLPEEWASMHQRFRRGLRRLVDWYGSTENPGEMVTKTAHGSRSSELARARDDDECSEIEDVVVLISHGAGCNALIGAITQQPVLADVAMSSLTMAKRRADFDPQKMGFTRDFSASSLDAALPRSSLTMSEMYELKLFANTDHLITPATPAVNRPATLAELNPRARFETGYTSALKAINFGSLYGSSPGSGQGTPANASLGSIRKSSGGPSLIMGPSIYNANTGGITVGSGMSTFSATRPDRSGSGTWGLWSPRQDSEEPDNEVETPMFLDFSHEKATRGKEEEVEGTKQKDESSALLADAPITTSGERTTPLAQNQIQRQSSEHPHEEEHEKFDEVPVPRLWAGTGKVGLWGTPRPPGEAERLRDFSESKRRWTVTER
ncbi:hypothetical protein HD806DRAFT_396892 [Xylariaceae sp. AK1471]|nr:hypothetical protein HD806DRAFT_396892 [Xylariaceae sp. AK1471]